MIGALLKGKHEPRDYAIVIKEEPATFIIKYDEFEDKDFDIYNATILIFSKVHGTYTHNMKYKKNRVELFNLYEVISHQGQ